MSDPISGIGAGVESAVRQAIEDAKKELTASEMAAAEKASLRAELDELRARLASVENRAPAVSEPAQAATAPVKDTSGEVARIGEEVADISRQIAEKTEEEGSEGVIHTATDATDDAEEVVEQAPVRRHPLFRPLFGGGKS